MQMANMNMVSAPALLRTNQAHAGVAGISNIIPGQEKAVDDPSKVKEGSFESFLVKAVGEMNEQQLDVNRKTEQFITDPDSVDVHEITTAMAKAQMSLSLAQTVIDRVVSGWNELSTNR